MIGYVEGRVIHRGEDTITVNAQGVGYELHCSENTLVTVDNEETVKLWVYTHMREDSLLLFGFVSLTERKTFLTLLKVNGIGPKMALHILSATTVTALERMIEESDVKALTQLPKVGKKTAEQMILTLKGKLVMADEVVSAVRFAARSQIVSALVHLGFKSPDVELVVDSMDPSIDVQLGVRQGLQALTTR
jgi:Holliday junction DNA helicase RuvA